MDLLTKILFSLFLSLLWYFFYKSVDFNLKVKMNKVKLLDTKSRIIVGTHGALSTLLCLIALLLKSKKELKYY